MATKQGMLQVIYLLEASGVANRPGSNEARKRVLSSWKLVLHDVSDEDLQMAAVEYLRDPSVCQFWPQPGKLIERIPGARAQAVDQADHAWGRVMYAIRTYGSYTPPGVEKDPFVRYWDFEPADREAVMTGIAACGGWRDLGLASNSDMAAHRASFRGAYRSIRERERLTALEGNNPLQVLVNKAFSPKKLESK